MPQRNKLPKQTPSEPNQTAPQDPTPQESPGGDLYPPATPDQLGDLSNLLKAETPKHVTLLSWSQVAQRLGLTPKDVAAFDEYYLEAIPFPVELAPGLSRWLEHEIDDYINCQILHRNTMFVMDVLEPGQLEKLVGSLAH